MKGKNAATLLLAAALSLLSGVYSWSEENEAYATHLHRGLKHSSKGGSKGSNKASKSASVVVPVLQQVGSNDMIDEVPDGIATNETLAPGNPTEPPTGKGKGGKGKGGKGKGGKGDKKSSKKSSKKGSKKSKSSKKDNSPSSPTSNSSKGGKGGKGGSPTMAPHPSGSSNDISRPPTPIEPPPSRSPAEATPTAAPGDCAQPVALSPYTIEYFLGDNEMPDRDDYMEVAEVTDTFLGDYMIERYADSTQATLITFETSLVTSTFRFGQPVRIEYASVACFSDNTTVLPRQDDLDDVLMEALDNPEPYIDMLVALGTMNAFSLTTAVNFEETQMQVLPTRSVKTESSNAAGIAAGAVGFTLLVAGLVLYKRRASEEEEEYYNQKGFDKSAGGDMTVAGDTFAGETYDGTASVSASTTGLSRDEEHGMVNVDLTNQTEECDNSSILPAWDGGFLAAHGPYKGSADSEESGEGVSQDDSELSTELPISNGVELSDTENAGIESQTPLNLGSTSTEEPSNEMHAEAQISIDTSNMTVTADAAIKSIEEFDAYLEMSDDEPPQATEDDVSLSPETVDESTSSLGEDIVQESRNRPLSVEEIESLLQTF